jgi:hypothetical protein
MEDFFAVVEELQGPNKLSVRNIMDHKIYSEFYVFDNKWQARAYAPTIRRPFTAVVLHVGLYSYFKQRD